MGASEVFWMAAAATWIFSAWCIVATVIEVVRGKSRVWSRDVILGVFLHGGTAILALWLAHLAKHGFGA